MTEATILIYSLYFIAGGAATDKLYYDQNTKLGVRNFYVTFKDESGKDINIGVYHFLPKDYILNQTEDISLLDYDKLLWDSPYSVLLLFHGRGQSRASFGSKYEMLSKLFHVIVFDYRCKYDTLSELFAESLHNLSQIMK